MTDLNDFFGELASKRVMPDVMLDLETMGTRPDSPIVAIGAVTFDVDTYTIGQHFYARVDLQSAVDLGARMDPSTVIWWMQQSDDARREITSGNRFHINEALQDFENWLREYTGPVTATKIWGNGATFDNVILKEHYLRSSPNIEPPWKFWNDRCFRTVAARYANIEKDERKGTHHKAIDDAIFQVEHLFKIRRVLKGAR